MPISILRHKFPFGGSGESMTSRMLHFFSCQMQHLTLLEKFWSSMAVSGFQSRRSFLVRLGKSSLSAPRQVRAPRDTNAPLATDPLAHPSDYHLYRTSIRMDCAPTNVGHLVRRPTGV